METKNKKTMHVTGSPKRRKTVSGKKQRKEQQIQIVYTPAKPFNRNRFLLRVATATAVVLALILGMSIFFRAEKVTVSGAYKYTPWEIKEASGIQDNDGLLGISEARISAKIRTLLPYVGSVRVGIKLPDTVNIEITELDAVYGIADERGVWWLIDSNGRIVDESGTATPKDCAQIIGVQITGAVVGEQAVALEPVSEEEESADPEEQTKEESTEDESQPEDNEESELPSLPEVTVIPAAQQLDAAIQLLGALEANGVLGNVATIDVTDVNLLSLWYGNQYHVTLGSTARLDYKISAMKAAMKEMGEYQNGYLDVSFTMWPDQVGYTPFDSVS